MQDSEFMQPIPLTRPNRYELIISSSLSYGEDNTTFYYIGLHLYETIASSLLTESLQTFKLEYLGNDWSEDS